MPMRSQPARALGRGGRVLVDVDVQNDFCLATGALSVPDSPNDLYRDLVRFAVDAHVPIIGSVDSHAFDAWEFGSNDTRGPNGEDPAFPDHCVKGTHGWLKVDGTLPPRFRFVPNVAGLDHDLLAKELRSGESMGLYFEKEVYSLFANPNAEAVLREVARDLELELIVFGVATDYCVRAAALGLAQRGYKTTVLEDAIRGISAEGSHKALDEMRAAGVRITTSGELLTGFF
jgi:nicotinamidase/pyrazinamidase